MHSLIRQAAFVIMNAIAIAAATGCQVSPSKSHPTTASPAAVDHQLISQQLIIKFKPNTTVCSAAGIAQLSASLQVPLEFVRIMSGNACVIKQRADSPSNFSLGQKILKQDLAVEWLEPDGVMKTQ